MHHRVVTAEEARQLSVIGDNQLIRLTGADTNGAYTLIEQFNEPGIGVPPHIHSHEDETFHVAEGQVTFQVRDQTIVADAGTTVHVARGVPHAFTVTGEGKTRVLLIISPPGLEAMFEELHNLPPGPPDMEQLTEICERYGISFV